MTRHDLDSDHDQDHHHDHDTKLTTVYAHSCTDTHGPSCKLVVTLNNRCAKGDTAIRRNEMNTYHSHVLAFAGGGYHRGPSSRA